jgi:hypothetical protein
MLDCNANKVYTINKGGENMANTSTKLVYVSEQLHKRLKVLSAEKGITIGNLIEVAIKKMEVDK